MDESVGFTPEERRTLEFAPLWMLGAVMGRYSGFGPLTLDALDALLADAGPSTGPSYDIVVGVRDHLDELVAGFEREALPIVSGLMKVDALLERRPATEAGGVRRLLVDVVGGGIARARGPFGMGATREDAERLELAATILAPTPPLGEAFEEEPA
jgi:hypothetical protein